MITRLLAGILVASLTVSYAVRERGDSDTEKIIALERAALDRWGKGDPQGFLEIMALDETYFDPMTTQRIDGLVALSNTSHHLPARSESRGLR